MNIFSNLKTDTPSLYKIFDVINHDGATDVAESLINHVLYNQFIKLYSYSVLKISGMLLVGDEIRIEHSTTTSLNKIKNVVEENPRSFKGYRWFFNPEGIILAADKCKSFEDVISPQTMIPISDLKSLLINNKSATSIIPFTSGSSTAINIEFMKNLGGNPFIGIDLNDKIYLVHKKMLPLLLFAQSSLFTIRLAHSLPDNRDYLEKIFWYNVAVYSRSLFEMLDGYEFPDKIPHMDILVKVAEEKNNKKWAH